MNMLFIGREKEQQQLKEYLNSKKGTKKIDCLTTTNLY